MSAVIRYILMREFSTPFHKQSPTMIEPDDSASVRARHEAAQWLARRHSGQWNEAQQRGFDDWLNESEQHRSEFHAMERLWEEIGSLRSVDLPELAAARAYRPPRRRWGESAARAAGLAALAILLVGLEARLWVPADVYLSAKGEQKTITLADGSSVDLNTDTALRVRISRFSREVELVRGEAFFTVAYEAERPFEVVTEEGRIRDLGTRFNVYKRPERVTVVVAEGRVALEGAGGRRAELGAGERLAFDALGWVSPVEKVDVLAATDWRAGRLAFKSMPLSEVFQEVARYHAIELLITDPKLDDLKVSGRFKTRDLGRLLASIEATLPVQVERIGPRLIRIERRYE